MSSPHAVVLRIRVTEGADLSWLTDALGECARNLEAEEAEGPRQIGLVADPDDPGRYAWEIVQETYS